MAEAPIADTWSCTQDKVMITTISHLWTIEGFSRRGENVGDSLESSLFGKPLEQKWSLKVYPKRQETASDDYIAIYLRPGIHTGVLRAEFKISILNAQRQETNIIKEKEAFPEWCGNGWGLDKYIR